MLNHEMAGVTFPFHSEAPSSDASTPTERPTGLSPIGADADAMKRIEALGWDEIDRFAREWRRAEEDVEAAETAWESTEAIDRITRIAKRNPVAAFGLGEAYESGRWFLPDCRKAEKLYLRAHRMGYREATFRLAAENPCRAPPGEGFDRSYRIFRQAAFTFRDPEPDGTICASLDQDFISEAESRAEWDPATRPLLALALEEAGDGRCEHWARRAAADGSPVGRGVHARCMLRAAEECRFDPSEMRAEALRLLREASGTDWRSAAALGEILFCSDLVPRDDAGALDLFLRASRLGTGDRRLRRARVLPYLEYYAASVPGLEPRLRGLSPAGRFAFRGRTPMRDCLELWHEPMPEWALLIRVTRTGPGGLTSHRRFRGPEGGFSNDVFTIIPGDPDMEEGCDEPRFVFHPTGFEMLLMHEPVYILSLCENLDEDELRRVFLTCVDSVRIGSGGGSS